MHGCLHAGLPELDQPAWTSDDFIRDFPVDFTLVLENVADPDHGVFAHQTTIFDSFAASAEYPMQVSTEPGKGGPKVGASSSCSVSVCELVLSAGVSLIFAGIMSACGCLMVCCENSHAYGLYSLVARQCHSS